MTQDEAVQLARRIARDVERIHLEPVVMLATVDDASSRTYLDLYRAGDLSHLGRLYSAEHYDGLLRQARAIVQREAVCLN